ncbi:MAG: hypothetical protein WCB58_23265 [Acidobacteriaceae bacterium]
MWHRVGFPEGYLFLAANLIPAVLAFVGWQMASRSGIESKWRKVIFAVSLTCASVGAISLLWFWAQILLQLPRGLPWSVLPTLRVGSMFSLIALVTSFFGKGTGRAVALVNAVILIPLCYVALLALIV